MPIISTDDKSLHRRLKIFVAQRPSLTIKQLVEELIAFGLDSGFGDLTESQRKEATRIIKNIRG